MSGITLQDIAIPANSKGGNVLITFPPLGFIVKVMLGFNKSLEPYYKESRFWLIEELAVDASPPSFTITSSGA